jgi:asparagine synthetase B (glutamine-hydrolysing)
MCGINGIITGADQRSVVEHYITMMNNSIIHRGTDDDGCLVDIYY